MKIKADLRTDFFLKMILLGDNMVGKTTFLKAFMLQKQSKTSKSVGWINDSNFCCEREVTVREMRILTRIFDTAGQEKYRSLTASYYRGAHGCLILFDVTKRATFENVRYWHDDLKEYSSQTDLSTILIGTKCHVEESQREVPRERAEKYAENIGIPYMEVSAEEGINVTEAFEKLADLIIESLHKRPIILKESTPIGSKESLPKKPWCSC